MDRFPQAKAFKLGDARKLELAALDDRTLNRYGRSLEEHEPREDTEACYGLLPAKGRRE